MANRTTMNLSLPPQLKKWIDSRVKADGFGTSSEFVRHVLREAWRSDTSGVDDYVEKKALEALDSGPATPMTAEDWREIRSEVKQRIAKASKRRKSA